MLPAPRAKGEVTSTAGSAGICHTVMAQCCWRLSVLWHHCAHGLSTRYGSACCSGRQGVYTLRPRPEYHISGCQGTAAKRLPNSEVSSSIQAIPISQQPRCSSTPQGWPGEEQGEVVGWPGTPRCCAKSQQPAGADRSRGGRAEAVSLQGCQQVAVSWPGCTQLLTLPLALPCNSSRTWIASLGPDSLQSTAWPQMPLTSAPAQSHRKLHQIGT